MSRRAWVVVGALFMALHAALFWLGASPEPRRLHGDEQMYWQAAERAIETGASELEPLWPPLYAWFVAGGRALAEASWPVELAQVLLLAASALLLRDLARHLELPPLAADGAAALLLLYPTLAAFAHFLWPEVLHLFWMLAAAWILAARRRDLVWCALLGAVLGAALLTKSLLGPFLPLLLLPLLRDEGAWRDRLARLAVVLVVLGATVAPVVRSNWRQHGRPMIASSARFNAWVGLNDRASRNFRDEIVTEEYIAWRRSAPDFAGRERLLAEKIQGLLAERGWLATLRSQVPRQYRRLLHRDSFFTDQLPGGLINARGGGYPRAPAGITEGLRWAHYFSHGAVLLAAPFGLAAGWAQRRPWALLGGAFLAYHAAIFLVLHVKTRYLLQLLPWLALAAAVAAHGWVRWRIEGGRPPLGPLGAAGAGLAAFLLLGLAFFGE